MKFMKETLECCDSLFNPLDSDRLPKLNPSLFLSILSFFFSGKLFLLMILFQHWFSVGNPVQDLKRPSEGLRELFVQIYRFSFAGLLQNILTESLVMYYIRIQLQTQKQVKQNEQNFQIDFAKMEICSLRDKSVTCCRFSTSFVTQGSRTSPPPHTSLIYL